jgi:hypothetical protein
VSTFPTSDRPEPAVAGSERSLFKHEVRREGRVVATLAGVQTSTGATVETEVFPLSAANGEAGLTRPFAFGSTEHARRFADEALIVFEYLNCSVT